MAFRGSVLAFGLFLGIVLVVWPVGLAGASLKSLAHYMMLSKSEVFPATVGHQVFATAPKWAYLYWYWNDYKPFFVCYALGLPGLMGLAAARMLTLRLAPLIVFTTLLLIAAHRAHIIGPEYLAHCLPFLALLGGCGVYGVSLVSRPLAGIAIAILAVPVVRWSPRVPLPGMDPRAQISRWPAAVRFLGSQWKPGNKIAVGSQPVSVAHWYLVYQGGVPPIETQFQTLPVKAPRPEFVKKLQSGFYRYIAASNMYEDRLRLHATTRHLLGSLRVIWRSDEHGTGPSRLIVYSSQRSDGPDSTPPVQ